jgi:hypothetical protein
MEIVGFNWKLKDSSLQTIQLGAELPFPNPSRPEPFSNPGPKLAFPL